MAARGHAHPCQGHARAMPGRAMPGPCHRGACRRAGVRNPAPLPAPFYRAVLGSGMFIDSSWSALEVEEPCPCWPLPSLP